MSNVDLHKKAAIISRGGGHLPEEEANYKILLPKLKVLDIELGKKVAHGTNADIYLNDEIEKIYGRKDLCLKVFWRSKSMWGYKDAGGISTIFESAIAQNLLAVRGICPRIYDLALIDGKTCFITDYLIGENKRVEYSDDRFDFYVDDWSRDHNFIAGKMIDLQGTKLKNYKEYKKHVVKQMIARNNAHGHTNNLYQSTGYHSGFRDTKERLARYNFTGFENKSVLDVGCSNGMMCRTACDLGARRVVGIDWPDMIEFSQELAILDGYFNIDFYGGDIKSLSGSDLKEMTGIDKFDIHLFLAMVTHVGWPEWIKNCDTLYFEGHGVNREFKVYHYPKK